MKNCLYVVIVLFFSSIGYAQSVDFNTITKQSPLRIRGGVSANTVFYNSNFRESRLPFTYYLNGNLTFTTYGFSMPLTFSYSNQGSELGYKLPFNLNRVSIHPKYKWVTGHIGDVSMTFSPYTLNGHQFTGAGFDLAPKGPFKVSVMAGRLLKATEDDADERTIPAFKRMGYGVKTVFEKEKFKIGVTGFYAKDAINSIQNVPEEKNVTPKENLVVSIQGGFKISKSLSIDAEYASSVITQDLRAEEITDKPSSSLAGSLFSYKSSTESYNAVKAGLNYQLVKTTVGLTYERISPGYQTLGAYYFNNDLENITFNAAQPFFKDKLNLSINVGYQKDDLDNQKSNATNRVVGAINATMNVSDKLNLSGSYSNFQTFTNVKLNQFEIINDNTNLDNITDTLNYRQLSQAANLNVNYYLKKTKTKNQSLNFNYSFNDVANEQGGIVRIGNASTFHNFNGFYSVGNLEKKTNIRGGVNITYNTIGRDDAITWGPAINFSKRLLEDKLNTNLGMSYSIAENKGMKSNIMNIRGNLRYVLLQKHNFILNVVQLFRNNKIASMRLNELTVTFGYNYNFGLFTPKKRSKKGDKSKQGTGLKIKFRGYDFEGGKEEHITELRKFSSDSIFNYIPEKHISAIQENIKFIEADKKLSNKEFKQKIILLIDELYSYEKIKKEFNKVFKSSFLLLLNDAEDLDEKIHKKYISIRERLKKAELENSVDDYKKYQKEFKVEESRLTSHRLMMRKLKEIYETNDEIEFRKKTKDLVTQILPTYYDLKLNNKEDEDIIMNIIQVKIADYYHKK